MSTPLNTLDSIYGVLRDVTTEDRVTRRAWEFRADSEGCKVASITFDATTGEILHLFTRPSHRRQGIATALYRMAQGLGATHSSQRTDDGQAWALSLNEDLPAWDRV